MSTSKRPPATTLAPRPAAPPAPSADAPSESPPLSTYPLAKLYQMWSQAALTSEQMMGQLLQHQIDQDQRLRRLEQAVQGTRQ